MKTKFGKISFGLTHKVSLNRHSKIISYINNNIFFRMNTVLKNKLNKNSAVCNKKLEEEKENSEFNNERDKIIDYLYLGKIKEAIGECRIFIHKYYYRYTSCPIGDYELRGVNDVSFHVAALDDLLTQGFYGKDDVFNRRVTFLTEYIKVYSDYRIPHVLLAWEYLKQNRCRKAIDWAIEACAIFSGSS